MTTARAYVSHVHARIAVTENFRGRFRGSPKSSPDYDMGWSSGPNERVQHQSGAQLITFTLCLVISDGFGGVVSGALSGVPGGHLGHLQIMMWDDPVVQKNVCSINPGLS
jgi:hypothetical protein